MTPPTSTTATRQTDLRSRPAPCPAAISRRVFLGGVTGAFAALALPRSTRAVEREPHFFLEVVFTGGLDATYLFDARPLALTAAGLQHNYIGQEPAEWAGHNGGRALVAPPAATLRPFQADLAVVNGVVMSTSFDGHDQNLNVLLTGNPFGGQSMLSRLNVDKPLDFLRLGPVEGSALEDGRFLPLGVKAAKELQASLAAASGAPEPFNAFVEAGYAARSAGDGRFSAGARALLDGARQSANLEQRLRSLQLPVDIDPEGNLGQELVLVREAFRRGVSQAALVDLTGESDFDVHASNSARVQLPLYASVTAQLAEIFAFLKGTAYDDRQSLLDVTTVLVASEFSRTMRQEGQAIDNTGTDHNPLSNTILVAGKGIRGGAVLGGTDFNRPDEALSGAHLALDPKRLKRMGLPIDWNTGLPSTEAPAVYAAEKYLGISSIVNTVYSLFGVDQKLYWRPSRDTPTAPILAALRRS